ncbi:hypothetical protein U9M48_001207 [Paspalum notatum var. saurae]|uniref:Reverse transcriptase domain-containing protein n=1 Tax=Paspalum notatum var. saurae TaxID=547442 RepID=A0AAQ3PJ18_PASNO
MEVKPCSGVEISKLQHRNIVKVLGYCHEVGHSSTIMRLLKRRNDQDRDWEYIWVEEYVPNGTLDIIICGKFPIKCITSRGYMSREYVSDGIVSVKNDVYSFGATLLETVSTMYVSSGFDSGVWIKRKELSLDTSDVVLDEDMTDDIPQRLGQRYSRWRLLALMASHQSFIRFFWNVIKTDLMALFDEFHRGNLAIDRLNFGNIILIPKVGDANKIQQYRPICLLNVSFKIFTKVATNRIAKKEFERGHFKIDFEKAYDKVRWDFFQQTLHMKGFSTTWCNWIRSFVQGGNVAVNVNGQNGLYFQTRKGLRQGDPLSPILFNIVADMLAIIINRAKSEGKVNGVIPHLVEDGLSILQYADDTVIFLGHDLEKARNMKVLLCLFEKLSGLKINFHKSKIFCFGQAEECENDYSELFGCRLGSFPFRYLGGEIRKETHWVERETSFGRLVLINSVLSSLLMFMLSFFAIPKGVLKKLEYLRSRFFSQNDQHKKKYHLIKWDQIRQPKEQGGLGIIDLEVQNKCLLSKCLFKLVNEDGIWQTILRNKYLKSKPFGSGTKRPGVSQFWAGLMDVKQDFISLGSFHIGDGSQDTWCGNQPLKNIYPSLFNIVRKKGATVADVMSSIPLNVSFRRGLYGERLHAWNELVGRVMNLELREERDVFKWGLYKMGVFTVKSMYKYLINKGIRVSQEIWQTKIPLKTKISMWYVKRGVLLTKDNLARRNWNGYQGCCFLIIIQHLFFDCLLAKFVWRIAFMTLGLSPPRNTEHLLNQWSSQGDYEGSECLGKWTDGGILMEIKRFTQVGLLCVQDKADRPTMADVLAMLHGEMEMSVPKKPAYFKASDEEESDEEELVELLKNVLLAHLPCQTDR